MSHAYIVHNIQECLENDTSKISNHTNIHGKKDEKVKMNIVVLDVPTS